MSAHCWLLIPRYVFLTTFIRGCNTQSVLLAFALLGQDDQRFLILLRQKWGRAGRSWAQGNKEWGSSSENESALAGERRQIHGVVRMERGDRGMTLRNKGLQKCRPKDGTEERTQVCWGTRRNTNCKTLGCSLQPSRSQFLSVKGNGRAVWSLKPSSLGFHGKIGTGKRETQ